MLRIFTVAGCGLLLSLALVAQQQDNPPPARQQDNSPPPQQSQPAASAGSKKNDQQKSQQKKPTAEQNPFPETQSEQAAHEGHQDNSAPAQQDHSEAQPGTSGQASQSNPNNQPDRSEPKKRSAADDNPFPESQSEKAAEQSGQKPANAAPPSHDYSSSQDHLKGLDLPGDQGSRIADGAGGTIMSPELGQKDTRVGQFYLQTGDFKGAYDRFAEAIKVDPGNADAVFGIAEAARHLNHRDEAVRNYQLYLTAVPDGARAKEARKALKSLGAGPNS